MTDTARLGARQLEALEILFRFKDESLSESLVWMRSTSRGSKQYYGPLNSLVERGFAERHGGPGHYRWSITQQGRQWLGRQA